MGDQRGFQHRVAAVIQSNRTYGAAPPPTATVAPLLPLGLALSLARTDADRLGPAMGNLGNHSNQKLKGQRKRDVPKQWFDALAFVV